MPIVTLLFVLAICIGMVAFGVIFIRLIRKNSRDRLLPGRQQY